MKKFLHMLTGILFLTAAMLSCSKDSSVVDGPGNEPQPIPGNGGGGQVPDSVYLVKVKAVLGIGSLIYDSVPARLKITSWDSAGMKNEKQVELTAGINEIRLPKSHARYQLELSKWGISEQFQFTKNEIHEGSVITLGGTKNAKKLRREETYIFASGSYQPNGTVDYNYQANGSLQSVVFFRKKPQQQDLQLFMTDHYVYLNDRVTRIDRKDENNLDIGFTSFGYDAQGRIVQMRQTSYDQQTDARLEYKYPAGFAQIKFFYQYNNGNSMEYTVKVKGGNVVEDMARSSTGGGEGGSYDYDFGVNPYAHMNMPNIFLSNISKNNLVSQDKGYSGSIPSGVPYKYEYTYDEDGYPVQLLTSYKSYVTGEHLYVIKKHFIY